MPRLLSVSYDDLRNIISFLTLDDVSILPPTCKQLNNIKRQIYELVKMARLFVIGKLRYIVSNCPKLKTLYIKPSIELRSRHFDLINQLDLESFSWDRTNYNILLTDDAILRIDNMKRLELGSMVNINIADDNKLEYLSVSDMSNIDKRKFPNLRKLTINSVYYHEYVLYELPVIHIGSYKELTPEICNLPLESLDLHYDGSETKHFELLANTKIKSLTISCRIIPVDVLNKMKLVKLLIGRSIIQSDITISTLTTLYMIHVTCNLRDLSCLTNLNELSLSMCVYPDNNFKCLAKLPITKLALLNCKYDIDVISRFKLTYLDLTQVNFDGNDIDKLPLTLRHLELSALKHTKITHMPYFPHMRTLKISNVDNTGDIFISCNALSDIARLPLTSLTIKKCGLDDNHMDIIARMSNLNSLFFQGNDITITGVLKLKKLPLRVLEIDNISLLHLL